MINHTKVGLAVDKPKTPDSSKRIIVFAPHPDDAVLGCGGTIAKETSEGSEVIIVLMTDGSQAFFEKLGIKSEPSPEEVKRIRREEFVRATEVLGVPGKNLIFFDFEDQTLENREKEAEEKTVDVIRKYCPADLYFPFVRDCHPDHRMTNRIVRHALNQLGIEGSHQYMITHTYAHIGPLFETFISVFKRNRRKADISMFLNLKKKAVEEYKSEMTIISARQKEPLHKSVDRFLTNREVFFT